MWKDLGNIGSFPSALQTSLLFTSFWSSRRPVFNFLSLKHHDSRNYSFSSLISPSMQSVRQLINCNFIFLADFRQKTFYWFLSDFYKQAGDSGTCIYIYIYRVSRFETHRIWCVLKWLTMQNSSEEINLHAPDNEKFFLFYVFFSLFFFLVEFIYTYSYYIYLNYFW